MSNLDYLTAKRQMVSMSRFTECAHNEPEYSHFFVLFESLKCTVHWSVITKFS